ncbi:MAG: hypothetical protein ABSE47_14585 [Acidimicrobiales bacterium]
MADTSGTPFEDELPAIPVARRPADPGAVPGQLPAPETEASRASVPGAVWPALRSAAVGGQAEPRAPASTVHLPAVERGTGPIPGSPEEAAIILRALAETSGSTPNRWAKPGLIAGTALIVIAMVVGLVIGAEYLRHVAGSGSPAASGGGTGPALNVTESNLKVALSTATSYQASHGGSLQGLTSVVFADANPSLTFASVSGAATEVAIATPVPGSLVLASFQSSPAACLGVLIVSSRQGAPIFGQAAATAGVGTYYFEAPAPAGLCNAITVAPPATSYVSTSGFPSEPLR